MLSCKRNSPTSRVHASRRAQGEAELAKARKAAEQTIVTADAELARSRRQAEQTVLLAEARQPTASPRRSWRRSRVLQVGLGEAAVLRRKTNSYGDPRLYAMALVTQHLSQSS